MQLLLAIGLARMIQWVNFDKVFAGVSRFCGVFHVRTYIVPYVPNKNRISRVNVLSDRFFVLIRLYFLHMCSWPGCQKRERWLQLWWQTSRQIVISNLITTTSYVDNVPTAAAVTTSSRRRRVGRPSTFITTCSSMYFGKMINTIHNQQPSRRFVLYPWSRRGLDCKWKSWQK